MTYNNTRHNHMLLMLADGATVGEISDELGISVTTVKHEIAAMKLIYNAKNVANLVARAYQMNILVPYQNGTV